MLPDDKDGVLTFRVSHDRNCRISRPGGLVGDDYTWIEAMGGSVLRTQKNGDIVDGWLGRVVIGKSPATSWPAGVEAPNAANWLSGISPDASAPAS